MNCQSYMRAYCLGLLQSWNSCPNESFSRSIVRNRVFPHSSHKVLIWPDRGDDAIWLLESDGADGNAEPLGMNFSTICDHYNFRMFYHARRAKVGHSHQYKNLRICSVERPYKRLMFVND